MARYDSSRRRFTEYRKRIKAGEVANPIGDDQVRFGKRRHLQPRTRSFLALLREFLGLARNWRGIVAASLLALTVATLLGLTPIYGTKLVIDYALIGRPVPPWLAQWMPWAVNPYHLLAFVAIATILISGTRLILAIWGRWQMTRATKRLQVEVRRDVFEHAVRLPLHRVHQLKSGGVSSILREDAGAVGDLLFSMIYNPWRAVTQLIGTLIILTIVDWRLLLGSLLILPTVFITHRTWIKRIRPMWRDVRATRTQVDGHSTEVFSGIRVVRGFSRQASEASAFTRNNHLMTRQELHVWWWMRGVESAWELLIPTATAALLWYGGYRILQDQVLVAAGSLAADKALSVGDLVMFMGYLASLLGPLATLASSATGLQTSLAALDRVLDLMAEPSEVPSNPNAVEIEPQAVRGHLALRDVTFKYPANDVAVLDQINLEVRPGKVVALVGSSGAGKTTLCNLVARFYDPTQGRIELDGMDLRDIEVESYRRLLGIVEQEVFLFDGTVAQNIAYGCRSAVAAEIEIAARRANAHEFIMELPQGYGTNIGERGVRLSGGQRQRLSIARAILADPRILILDEATSNLDTQSEQLIQQALNELFAQRTTFVIAHRLSTVTHADQIVVLNHGRIVEQGTHTALMELEGEYFDMVERQRQFATVPMVADDASTHVPQPFAT